MCVWMCVVCVDACGVCVDACGVCVDACGVCTCHGVWRKGGKNLEKVVWPEVRTAVVIMLWMYQMKSELCTVQVLGEYRDSK